MVTSSCGQLWGCCEPGVASHLATPSPPCPPHQRQFFSFTFSLHSRAWVTLESSQASKPLCCVHHVFSQKHLCCTPYTPGCSQNSHSGSSLKWPVPCWGRRDPACPWACDLQDCPLSFLFLKAGCPWKRKFRRDLLWPVVQPSSLAFPTPQSLQHYPCLPPPEVLDPCPANCENLGRSLPFLGLDFLSGIEGWVKATCLSPSKTPPTSFGCIQQSWKTCHYSGVQRKPHISVVYKKRNPTPLNHITTMTPITLGSYDDSQPLQCARHCARPSNSSPLSCHLTLPLTALYSPEKQPQMGLVTCSLLHRTQPTVELGLRSDPLTSELVPVVCTMLSPSVPCSALLPQNTIWKLGKGYLSG